jgi:outer membrane protein assembly factor BamB
MEQLATWFHQEANLKGGFIVHLGVRDGELAVALAGDESFGVHGICLNPAEERVIRERIREQGVYGGVAVEGREWSERLIYDDNLVNIVIVDGVVELTERGLNLGEVMRIVCPGRRGMVFIGSREGNLSEAELRGKLEEAGIRDYEIKREHGIWAKVRKPYPVEMKEYTHWRSGADRNPAVRDELVEIPNRLKWIEVTEVMMDTGVSARISCEGRLVYVSTDAVPGVRVSGNTHYLYCRDAFNGRLLWKIPCQREVPEQTLVGGDGYIYVVLEEDGFLKRIEAERGEVVKVYQSAGQPDEVIYHQGVLILAGGGPVRGVDPETGNILWEKVERGNYMVAGEGYVYFFQVGGRVLFKVEVRSGEERGRWSLPFERIDFLAEGKLFFRAGNAVAAVSAESGSVLWRTEMPAGWWYGGKALRRQSARCWYSQGKCWALLRATPDRTERVVGLDPGTGNIVATCWLQDTGPARCYLHMMSEKFLYCTDFHCFKLIDGGEYHKFAGTRPQCGRGGLIANGLVYPFPQGCRCYAGMRAFSALASAPPGPVEVKREGRFIRGPAYGQTDPNFPAPGADEWPLYRHDPERSGGVKTNVPVIGDIIWNKKLGKRVSAPVVAHGRVYVSLIDEHQIVCLDAETGEREFWRYFTDSRVDTPPTIHDDLCIFGCHSGWVVCLKAESGELVWKFRAAPEEKRIMYFSQLYSPWPVIGSVLVKPDEDKVFFAAGYHGEMDGGIYVYALRCHTGEVLWEKVFRSEGPHFKKDPATGKFLQLRLREITGVRRYPGLEDWREEHYLNRVDEEKWFFRSGGLYKKKPGTLEVYWLTDEELAADPEKAAWETWEPDPFAVGYPHWIRVWDFTMNDLLVGARHFFNVKNWGFYYRNGMPVFNEGGTKIRSLPCGAGFLQNQGEWRFGYRNPGQYKGLGRPLVYDERAIYGAWIRKKSEEYRDLDLIGSPTRIFAVNPQWEEIWSLPVRLIWVKGMVVTENALFVANVAIRRGWRESILQKERGEIRVFSLDQPRELGKIEIPGAPIFDGLIAAKGRLYVSTMNGRVICLGENKRVDKPIAEGERGEREERGFSRRGRGFFRGSQGFPEEGKKALASRRMESYFGLGEEEERGRKEEILLGLKKEMIVERGGEKGEKGERKKEEKIAFLNNWGRKEDAGQWVRRGEKEGKREEESLAEDERIVEIRGWEVIAGGGVFLLVLVSSIFLLVVFSWRKTQRKGLN